jgi:S-adenosyl methyltransferase
MARSPGNATLTAVSPPSTHVSLSKAASRCGTLAAVTRPSWAPSGVDIDKPSVARVYDYYLGGSHNFAADREFADKVIAAVPDALWLVHENRAFLRRAVRFLLSQGVDQFIDLGSGIPTVGDVHEVAAAINPSARTVYIDHDQVAVEHSRAILSGNPNAAVYAGHLEEPDAILADPDVVALLDMSRPIGVLMIAVLHFIPDNEAALDVVKSWAQRVAPGSYIAITHGSADRMSDGARETESLYNRSVASLTMRTRDEVVALFTGETLVEPGVVQIPYWRSDQPDDLDLNVARYPGYAGVARID